MFPKLKTRSFLSLFVTGAVIALSVHVFGGTLAIKGGTVLTVTGGTIENGDILVRDGKIAALGTGLEIPEDADEIDARGRYVMPGIIDAHSHLALDGDINEATSPITPQVRMTDAISPDDYGIYCALAGGVTAAKLMHGSANVIGGVNATVKLKYNRPLAEMLIPGVRQQIKMALGENPKRVYGRRNRMPATRLGIFALLRQKLLDAQQYREKWAKYRNTVAKGEDPDEPKRDLELETLAKVLAGEIAIDCHCYVASEIVTLLGIAEEFELPLTCLSHALEAYKVRDRLAGKGISVLTHTDWWGYKHEAYDAIPYQPGMLAEEDINVVIVSDSGDVIRRLNGEAAKVVKYSGVSEEQALAMITINAARALEIDSRCGSIEVGKDADLAIFDRHPLDSFSKCVTTLVEGEVLFNDIQNNQLPGTQGGAR
jgi:imidazolonepropionase-like amidohydrolase